MVRRGMTQGNNLSILFVGQCLMSGHDSVDPASTYVGQAISGVTEQFPQLKIKYSRKHLHHPKGLKAILSHRLMVSRPDIVVISAIASFAALYTRVNMLYEIAPEVMDTARDFLQKLQSAATGTAVHLKPETSLDKLVAFHPPIEIDEYEQIIDRGVEMCKASGVRVVIVGPGRFNEDVRDNYSIPSGDLPGVFASINEMVRRVGERADIPVVDAQGALSEHSGEVFLRDNIRWSQFGHHLVARELERVLASEILLLKPLIVGNNSE